MVGIKVTANDDVHRRLRRIYLFHLIENLCNGLRMDVDPLLHAAPAVREAPTLLVWITFGRGSVHVDYNKFFVALHRVLQLHHHRSEHWVVISGIAQVTNGEQEFQLEPDQSTYIPQGTRHRLANQGMETLEIIEVQTGSYLGEDDIVRFADQYDRA